MMILMSPGKYVDDYETIESRDERGREKIQAVYRGEYFETNLDEGGLVRFKQQCFLFMGIAFLLHVAGGFLNPQGMYQMYIALPYVIAFFPMLFAAQGMLRLPREIRPYRRDEMGYSFKRIKTSVIILAGFLGMGFIGQITFLFLNIGNIIPDEYLYLLMEGIAFSSVIILVSLQKKIQFQPVKGGHP